MLRVKTDHGDIEVRFGHKWMTPTEISNMTCEDDKIDDDRRCSLASLRWAVLSDGKNFAEGLAICHSHDNFCKATGRKLALADAMTGIDVEIRTAIWQVYKEQCKI